MSNENQIKPSGRCLGSNPLTEPYDIFPAILFYLFKEGDSIVVHCDSLCPRNGEFYCRYVRKPKDLRKIDYVNMEVTETVEDNTHSLFPSDEYITRPIQKCKIFERIGRMSISNIESNIPGKTLSDPIKSILEHSEKNR